MQGSVIYQNETDQLIETHRVLIRSVAKEDDNYSLAQPSPLRYVPSITTDHTAPVENTSK